MKDVRKFQKYLLFIFLLCLILCDRGAAATLPSGFTERGVASGLASPTAMEFAPDGRLFVCEQGGKLRVIRNDTLLAKPFLTVTVDVTGERGLLGVTFDPNFSVNRYVYVYYTSTSPTTHNHVSRFTASGDTALAGSELPLLDLPTLGASNHNGGAMHFASDGKLFIAVGENAVPSNSQNLGTLLGKILRMNSDGSIPTDNPFYATASGNNRLIWAYGVRNPFTFSFQQGTGKLYINDVGQDKWEEIDYGIAGANYGWPIVEGIADTIFTDPMFAYGHTGATNLTGCAITGGAFYNPTSVLFPASYVGEYFFADYCNGWIRKFHPTDSTAADFASGISSPVDLKVSTDGSLYYLARGSGSTTGIVYKIVTSVSLAPAITLQPLDQTVSSGTPATFTTGASGNPPLSYQWQKNSVNIPGATSATYTLSSAQLTDNGALFRCVVTNSFGNATSNAARLTVTTNLPPTATITSPAKGSFYAAGDTIYFSGTGNDPEQGMLGPAAFSWRVDFQHDLHHHPFYPQTSGITSGSFVIPTLGETSDTVWYRIFLTVTDSGGLSRYDTTDIIPRKSNVTLATTPPGLQILLDGTTHTSPYTFTEVVGIQREITAVTPQSKSGQTFFFTSWSDLLPADHIISTPAVSTTFTAGYVFTPAPPALISPANAASNQPTSLTFRWNSSSGAATYRFQLATDSLFAAKVIDDSTLTDTSRLVNALASNSRYYWRANAKNLNGTSAWSTFRSLTTLDNVAPSVSITAPAANATVANTVSVTASASDNVAVAGVQFKLDGVALGAEDTIPPYSLSWNTLSSSNGVHILSATARDGAGNVTTSANVSLTVSNNVSSSDLVIYQDALTPIWINTSWAGTYTFNNTEQSVSPPNSIKCVTNSYGAMRVRSSDWSSIVLVNPSLYSRLEFSIYNTTPGLSLNIALSNDAGVFATMLYTTAPLNQWATVSYPISQLDPANTTFQFITWQSNTTASKTFYIDNIRLVGLASQADTSQVVAHSAATDVTPPTFALEEAFPNPFNPSTTITFDVPLDAHVLVKVYDVLGREMAVLVDERRDAGRYQTTWNPGSLSGGVYFVRMEAIDGGGISPFVQMKKIMYVK